MQDQTNEFSMPPIYNDKQKSILKRSEKELTSFNYSDALDGNISKLRDNITKVADNYTYLLNNNKDVPKFAKLLYMLNNNEKIPTGMSNCTLTATQWINPKEPLMRAQTIIDNGEDYGYIEIPEEHVIPGDLVIASSKDNTHHTMLVYDFTKKPEQRIFLGKQYNLPFDHPLVRYSSGTTHPSGYRKSIGLLEYIDNSNGKNDVKYFRHYDPGEFEILLPEIIVTPDKSYISKDKIQINQRIKSKLQKNFNL